MSSRPGSPDRSLELSDLASDPITQFRLWFGQAGAVMDMPEAMTLATVDEQGRPDARMVLLKEVGPDGFHFFTNYDGVKAGQLAANPVAALVFHWPALDRQVRVQGPVSRLAEADSDAYFRTRSRGSQIGAWASPQSRPLEADRAALDRLAAATEERFAGQDRIPRPAHWGGYRVEPRKVEFWQGRRARLHDRFVYLPEGEDWSITRLAP